VGGRRAGCDDDAARGEAALAVVASVDRQGVRVDEAGAAVEHRDAVAQELVADHLALRLDDVPRAQRDVVHGDGLLEAVALAVDRALVEPGQIEDRLPDRLRGDRPGVHARAAQRDVTLD